MIFIYIVFAGVLLYFVLRYAVRDAMIEKEANKDKLIYLQKSSDLLDDIGSLYSMVSSKSNKHQKEAHQIYNESVDILTSDMKPEGKYQKLKDNQKKMSLLNKGN
ncbi:MAG TPA: hypothetical protein VK115_08895 [Staphylococcus sp.]|nr:hypothetical protein [Staphylococcus sp.]